MRHALKTWVEPFSAVWSGDKRYEIRACADREFAVGDYLDLLEFNPEGEFFTGRMICARVTYMSPGGSWGLPPTLCVMSIDVERKEVKP